MPNPVTRTCLNMTKDQIIEIYNLDSDDIEWYKFLDEENVQF